MGAHFLLELLKLIQSVRPRLIVVDENDENLGDYFFLSAIINLVDMLLRVISKNEERYTFYKDFSCVLFEKAKETSVVLGIDHPEINGSDYINLNIGLMHDSVKKWLDDLRYHAKNRIL